MMSMKTKKFLRRRFQLHWGGGWITEEARSKTQYHEPSIQLLSFDSVFVTTMTVFTKGAR